MRASAFSIVSLLSVALLGAGCQTAEPTAIAPVTSENVPVATDTTTTVLVSNQDSLKYCNGADMDSDGYRKTVVVEKSVALPSGQTQAEHVRSVILAATTDMCQQVFQGLDLTVTDGTLHIPRIDGWAGVSITMCSCRPEVEVNALRVPGIKDVVWD